MINQLVINVYQKYIRGAFIIYLSIQEDKEIQACKVILILNKSINFEVPDDDKSIKPLTLENQIIMGKVVDIYDGDTCKIVMPFKNELYRWNCRLIGIDTPELRTRNDKRRSVVTLFETSYVKKF